LNQSSAEWKTGFKPLLSNSNLCRCTLVWIPLTIAAIGRALWANYKITDKRVAIMSTSPLRTERIDVPMDEIVDVIAIGGAVQVEFR
jgi:hypothetical protein